MVGSYFHMTDSLSGAVHDFASQVLMSVSVDETSSSDGDTYYFDIVEGVLQGDTLAPYHLIICLGNVLRTSIDKVKDNRFNLGIVWDTYPSSDGLKSTTTVFLQGWLQLKDLYVIY